MAYTTFPRLFYFELRYQGNPGVPFCDGLGFSLGDGTPVRYSQYRTNGTVVAYEMSWDSSLPSLTPFTVSGIKGCTITSAQVDPTSLYDYSYSDNIPTYYLDVTPASAYTCHVYSGSSTANPISGATVEIRYDGNGKTYSGIGAGDYVISATTNASGDASLKWFSGSPVVVAWEGSVFSSGYTTGATTGSTNNIKIGRDSMAPVTTYSYRGHIKDAKNGTAIANATVLTINGYSGVADSSGYFSINLGPNDPGNQWGDITGVDGYVPFHGILSSTSSSDVTIPTYYLYPDDSLPVYDIAGNKILTIYDMSRLMYDQWNDVSKEILGRTLNVDNVMNALYTLTKAHCIKDTTGTLYDFTGKPSGYCPTAFVWDESSTEWGGYAGLINSISKELLNYQWTDNQERLAGCANPPFEFEYPYKRCVTEGLSNFYKMYTHSMSSITASFYLKNYANSNSVGFTMSAWGESSGLLTFGYSGGTSGISYTVSNINNNRILANFPEVIPLTWQFVIDINKTIVVGNIGYPRVLDLLEGLEVGNDKFTVNSYTTKRSGNQVTITVSGYFNMLNFENDFTFKIPVKVGGEKWNIKLTEIADASEGTVHAGSATTIQLVSSTSSTATVFATSDVTIASSGVFPSTTLSVTQPRPLQTFINGGVYLKLVGTKGSDQTFKYLKATTSNSVYWFELTKSGNTLYANITPLFDTDNDIVYDISENMATITFSDMTLKTTKS